MNKKVLTLCAGLLLSGSLASVYATDVKQFVEFGVTEKDGIMTAKETSDGVFKFVADIKLEDNHGAWIPCLVIDQEGVTIDGNGHVFEGRLAITAENVTVKNLIIKNTVNKNGGSYWKNAISVVADNVKLENNTIICSVGEGDNLIANGIVFFPTAEKVNYVLTNNTIQNASGVAKNDGSSSSAFIVAEGAVATGQTDKSAIIKDANFSLATLIAGNKIEKCDIDYSHDDWTNASGSNDNTPVTKAVQVTPILDEETGEIQNKEAIKDLLKLITAENASVKFNGPSVQFFAAVKGADIKNVNEAIQCSDKNLLFGNVSAPDNGLVSEKVTKIPTDSEDLIQATNWGNYDAFETDGTSNKVVLVWGGATVRAIKDAAGNVSYTMGAYDPNSTDGNEASQYFFTLTPYELQANRYELRLRDCYGNFVKVDGQYVTVDNVNVQVNGDGKYEYSSSATDDQWKELDGDNAVFPEELALKANNNWVTIDWEKSSFTTVSQSYLAHAFGVADIQVANMYAETLLQRYGEYFTLKIEYDKDGDGEDDTDLTSIFTGELTPVKKVWYDGGDTGYDLADPKATKFMLMNEKNEILALTTDPETTWSSGTNVHAYQLKTISAKEYELDLPVNGGKGYYKTLFSFEYTPGTTPASVTSIDAIYVDSREIGCYLDKQVPVLAGTGNIGTLDAITITLNPSAVVDAKTWLTSPVYYNVTVKNANKKAQHYGKVLGLEEEGYVDYVAPENVDQTMPEGQFAIEYVDYEKDQWNNPVPAYYKFTNRENRRTFTVRARDFYEVNMAKNMFAYRDYQYNLMDTLEIAPVKNYTSEDGFKRFTAADLNNNTYTVAMRLLNGDSLNVVENHNDKHRVGLDEDKATEWRIEMSQVKLIDATNDFLRYVPDTVTVEVPIRYYVSGKLKETTIDAEKVKNNKNYYVYNADAALKICTYILKNTDNNEYLYGYNYLESKGNEYYVCDKYESNATRIAFKKIGNETLNLVPAYATSGNESWNIKTVKEDEYETYAATLGLSYNKIIGGATTLTGVLKDEQYLYKAPTNDLFVINVAEAPTYKKLAQGDKIIISRAENKDEVIYEQGFGKGDSKYWMAGINNRAAYKDIKPTLYVDTAYVNRAGNYTYQYLLGVRINRVDTTYKCNVPDHGTHRADTTYGEFLINMVDSALANKDVHNNKFEHNGEYKLSFVKGYRTNDALFFTNEAGKVVSSMKIGDANSNIAKFAFKMVDEADNEFVIETGTGYNEKKVYTTGAEEVVSVETEPGYLRWVNGNLVVTKDINEAEHFTMETSDKEATANENIAAGNVVVAGVDGAVVVKGAEGKNVIVSTILGKVVANEVVSSDNATIAAPAGIVVVSVDGESFKVVVK